jgi:hypothetical protein
MDSTHATYLLARMMSLLVQEQNECAIIVLDVRKRAGDGSA